MIEMGLTASVRGPVFDARADTAARDFYEHARAEIADEGVNLVVGRLVQVIRHPTPFYWTQIRTDRLAGDPVVTDRGVVYGPWLEGTSSRNQTTRFKGYKTFRQMRDRLQERAPGIAQHLLAPYLARMRG